MIGQVLGHAHSWHPLPPRPLPRVYAAAQQQQRQQSVRSSPSLHGNEIVMRPLGPPQQHQRNGIGGTHNTTSNTPKTTTQPPVVIDVQPVAPPQRMNGNMKTASTFAGGMPAYYFTEGRGCWGYKWVVSVCMQARHLHSTHHVLCHMPFTSITHHHHLHHPPPSCPSPPHSHRHHHTIGHWV